MAKRPASEQPSATPINEAQRTSEAAQFNERVLQKLKRAFEADPEVDLSSRFPISYSTRLLARKTSTIEPDNAEAPIPPSKRPKQEAVKKPLLEDDVRSLLRPSDLVEIIHPLSEVVRNLLVSHALDDSPTPFSPGPRCSMDVIKLLQKSEVVAKAPIPSCGMIFKCEPGTIAKVVRGAEDYTEYTTLQYLQDHMPDIPAPRPLGLLRMGRLSIIFMSYMPGKTLETVWKEISLDQKVSVQGQLNTIFTRLRSLPCPQDFPLGGVAGEGCKDQRRNLRRSINPITSAKGFEDFQFSNPIFGSSLFVQFLRNFAALESSTLTFTHGDLRPDNITVEISEDETCTVTGIIDWEYSGFYPEHYESTKLTNCLATNEDNDWYRFLPPCISPHKYPIKWLLDYVWGRHVE